MAPKPSRSGRRLPSSSLAALLVAACATSKPAELPPPERNAVITAKPAPQPELGLYTTESALGDVLAGDWEYLGTGPWPGIERSHACAFRNERVLIVNAYCTLTERQAFRIDVYSPEQGRLRIYAESTGPLSQRTRKDYFIFTAESERVPEAPLGPVTLAMSFEELSRYERARYDAYLPACYSGERHDESVGGCLGELSHLTDLWAERNHAFLEGASDDWYRVVADMRLEAERHGVDPE